MPIIKFPALRSPNNEERRKVKSGRWQGHWISPAVEVKRGDDHPLLVIMTEDVRYNGSVLSSMKCVGVVVDYGDNNNGEDDRQNCRYCLVSAQKILMPQMPLGEYTQEEGKTENLRVITR